MSTTHLFPDLLEILENEIAENGPKMASNDEMVLMKVVRFIDNISLFNLYNFH